MNLNEKSYNYLAVLKILVFSFGNPSFMFTPPSRDYEEPAFDLVKILITDADSTFAFRVNTRFLLDAHITVGSVALVDFSLADQAKDGDLVLARIDQEDLLGFLRFEKNTHWIYPANPECKPVKIPDNYSAVVRGIVTYVINNKETWKDVCTGRRQ
ncbi:S24 family peptidase [Filimonas effusa]|uniref:Peptidase S24/S26A/S26B/S26C domain-containing protein n=1 Tax=Filimonas effusa TaxID=2508721 RepID=A0A4Q1DDQ7_9BACT|nr:S24 family peptidase [Filimonas effusa]RXK87015.1 hypothetical protein ESB13_09595 [Filimonas effusa]